MPIGPRAFAVFAVSCALLAGCSGKPAGADAGCDGEETDAGAVCFAGAIDHLYFAVVGDTRPTNIDQTSQYPTATINQIYADIAGMSPQPQFVLTTGDYMYANTLNLQQQPQLDLYMTARKQYAGPQYAVMGNHECSGYTDGNCTPGNVTANYTAYMNTMVAPLGSATPYYRVDFAASDKSWTAKLVVVACNAWDTTQSSWLTEQLALPTTYTIVSMHEGLTTGSENPPCLPEMTTALQNNPYNVLVVGHTHTYATYVKQITVGTGGAPPQGSAPYGFATIQEQGGTFSSTQYDAATNAAMATYTLPP